VQTPGRARALVLTLVSFGTGVPTAVLQLASNGLPPIIGEYLRPYAAIEEQNRIDLARADNTIAFLYRAIGYDPLEAGRLDRRWAAWGNGVPAETHADRIREFIENNPLAFPMGATAAGLITIAAVVSLHYKYELRKKLVETQNTIDKIGGAMDSVNLELRWAKRWGMRDLPKEGELDEEFRKITAERDETKKAKNLSDFLDKLETNLTRTNDGPNRWDGELDQLKEKLKQYEKIEMDVDKTLETEISFKALMSPFPDQDVSNLYRQYVNTKNGIKCKMNTKATTIAHLDDCTNAIRDLKTTLGQKYSYERFLGELATFRNSYRRVVGGRRDCPATQASMVDSVVDAYIAKRMAAQASVSGASD
jgi:hypothetical protein